MSAASRISDVLDTAAAAAAAAARANKQHASADHSNNINNICSPMGVGGWEAVSGSSLLLDIDFRWRHHRCKMSVAVAPSLTSIVYDWARPVSNTVSNTVSIFVPIIGLSLNREDWRTMFGSKVVCTVS